MCQVKLVKFRASRFVVWTTSQHITVQETQALFILRGILFALFLNALYSFCFLQ